MLKGIKKIKIVDTFWLRPEDIMIPVLKNKKVELRYRKDWEDIDLVIFTNLENASAPVRSMCLYLVTNEPDKFVIDYDTAPEELKNRYQR